MNHTSCFDRDKKQRQKLQNIQVSCGHRLAANRIRSAADITGIENENDIKYLPWQRCQRHPRCSRVNAAATATRLP